MIYIPFTNYTPLFSYFLHTLMNTPTLIKCWQSVGCDSWRFSLRNYSMLSQVCQIHLLDITRHLLLLVQQLWTDVKDFEQFLALEVSRSRSAPWRVALEESLSRILLTLWEDAGTNFDSGAGPRNCMFTLVLWLTSLPSNGGSSESSATGITLCYGRAMELLWVHLQPTGESSSVGDISEYAGRMMKIVPRVLRSGRAVAVNKEISASDVIGLSKVLYHRLHPVAPLLQW